MSYDSLQMKSYSITLLSLILVCCSALAQSAHPRLIFNSEELQQMKDGMATAPLFEKSINKIISEADKALETPIEVPVPVDGGGGPVHEKHKNNYYEMMDCGIAYQFTSEKRYADRVRDMLFAYSKLYPTLDYHNLGLSPVPGKLFWQTLNESVWLVHTSIAYDCIQETLNDDQKSFIETNLIVPMAEFIMSGTEDNRANLKTFNKMHNHGTWATAAVGMAGLAIDDEDLVDKALYGTDMTGKNGGFLQQMDELFSPDGYFTEGAYYQRYALWPFVIFAQCIDHSRPEIGVFDKRDKILFKAFDTLFQLSYDGEFMHINDAMEKGLSAQEIVYAANILYGRDPGNEMLPFIARNYHDYAIPCLGGYKLAAAVEQGAGKQPPFRTTLLRDGRDGTEGGIGIIRDNEDNRNAALTLKATSHGLSHGHYDKLTMAFYDNGKEILPDYGASRFINLEAKHSGHYTRENDSFCKQSVAHNTLVADQTSHFGGIYKVSSKHHSDFENIYSSPDGKIKAMTAREDNAYADKGIAMKRSLVYASLPGLEFPVILDLIKATSETDHTYDLPYWYRGHMVSTNLDRTYSGSILHPLGDNYGYQHIRMDAVCDNEENLPLQFTFFNGNRMYSLTTAVSSPASGILMHLGANDPDFNLRDEKAWMLRVPQAANCTFATIIEPHGQYDVIKETAENTRSLISDIKIISDTPQQTEVEVVYGPESNKAKFVVGADGTYNVII